MDKSTNNISLHPNAWLKEMAKINPVKWNFSRSFRAAIAVALPMAIGYATNMLAYAMWISMGAMFHSISERDAPYSFTIRKILITAPIGASGFLMGYLGVIGLDWIWIVVVMSLLGFCLAIVSGYSSTVSVGCLQFMVMSAVSLGNPAIGDFWKNSLLLLCGSLFYLVLLFIEKLIRPQQIRKDAIEKVLRSLIEICQAKLDNKDIENFRLQFNLKYQNLYNLMLQTRYQALGHSHDLDQTAEVVQNLDNIFAALMAQENMDEVLQLKVQLQRIADAFKENAPFETLDTVDSEPSNMLNDLTLALWGKAHLPAGTAQPAQPPQKSLNYRLMLQKLAPGQATLRSAKALALCTAIGYSIRWVDQASHWYWVPMTVAIVMKPDLGSIFVRAVQRTVGTAAGVVIGSFILAMLPVGPLFILVMAAISFVLPWLAPRNYALTAFAITPLVLVLIDFISHGGHSFDYASLRLVDTLIGCAIVLIFGYLLWPRRHSSELDQAMNKARQGVAHYLELVLANRLHPVGSALNEARRAAYGQLVDMRAALQKSMAEPPPAGYEAAAWFPLVACAARLCDAITVYSASASTQPDPQEWAWLQQMPQAIAGLADLPEVPDAALQRNSPEALLIMNISKETQVRERLYERVAPDLTHSPKTAAAGA